jgi:hypothetical protein
MDALHLSDKHPVTAMPETAQPTPLPVISHAERAFWRRAVELERSRQRRGRPAPFPFQPA